MPLAHHYDHPRQQYEAAKLGMWLFLATEVLLFGGLFCAYTVFRGNHPEVFRWGSAQLDVGLGAANTGILILSSLSMALAVNFVMQNRRRAASIALSLTFVLGLCFMAIKSVEYEHKFHNNLVWGAAFYDTPHGAGAEVADVTALTDGDLANGRTLWNATCRSCHGAVGEGVTGQGLDIRTSAFIMERDNDQMLAFLKVGRMPNDPLNTTKRQMPPRGGNPFLKDQDLLDVIAHLRTLLPQREEETEPPQETESATEDAETPAPAPAEPVSDAPSPPAQDQSEADAEPEADVLWVPKASIPPAAIGPSGLRPAALGALLSGEEPLVVAEPEPAPANAHLFFGFYFLMTGLHGIHVLIGLLVILWLLFRTLFGRFGPRYSTPVEMGGLYWHIVDVIWIFLFPLMYLIS